MKNVKHSMLMCLVAVPALAQPEATFLLRSSNTVSTSSPTTTIEVWAKWTDPGARFVFHWAGYDLHAADGKFSSPVNVLSGAGSSTGVIANNTVLGALNGQMFFFPPILNPGYLLDDPILLATYEWTTDDFAPREVNLRTSNTNTFLVFVPSTGVITELYPHQFTPGSGVIKVVPAPAAWLALALPLVASRRRRLC